MSPIGDGDLYRQAAYAVPSPTVVTTRQVPISCEVCKGRGHRPEDPDDDDAEWIRCQPCDGKGWLMVTETTTTRVST